MDVAGSDLATRESYPIMRRLLAFLAGVALLAGLLLAFSGAAPAIISVVMILLGCGLGVAAFAQRKRTDTRVE